MLCCWKTHWICYSLVIFPIQWHGFYSSKFMLFTSNICMASCFWGSYGKGNVRKERLSSFLQTAEIKGGEKHLSKPSSAIKPGEWSAWLNGGSKWFEQIFSKTAPWREDIKVVVVLLMSCWGPGSTGQHSTRRSEQGQQPQWPARGWGEQGDNHWELLSELLHDGHTESR